MAFLLIEKIAKKESKIKHIIGSTFLFSKLDPEVGCEPFGI